MFDRRSKRQADSMASPSNTDTIEQIALALAVVGAFVANSRALLARKSAIKVRGGRARARNAPRDERGRFLARAPNGNRNLPGEPAPSGDSLSTDETNEQEDRVR